MLAFEIRSQKTHHMIKCLKKKITLFRMFRAILDSEEDFSKFIQTTDKHLGIFPPRFFCLDKANSKLSKLKNSTIVYTTANKTPHFGYS